MLLPVVIALFLVGSAVAVLVRILLALGVDTSTSVRGRQRCTPDVRRNDADVALFCGA